MGDLEWRVLVHLVATAREAPGLELALHLGHEEWRVEVLVARQCHELGHRLRQEQRRQSFEPSPPHGARRFLQRHRWYSCWRRLRLQRLQL